MKRDARIGLAVVLVLGLAVVLLIGRALYKNGEHVASTEGENAAGDAAVPYSGEAGRVSGAETGTAANMAVPTGSNAVETAAVNSPADLKSPGVQKFIASETSQPLQVAPAPAHLNPGISLPPPVPTQDNNPTPPPPTGKPPVEDAALLLDHERNVTASVSEPDCYGYTVAPGDNGWKIAFKVYGDGKYTQKILDANPGLHADRLKAGSLIKIPTIPHKTILQKLPSFAEASKGGSKNTEVASGKKSATKEKEEPAAASKPVAAETGSAESTTHKVEPGETLAAIAKKHYGSAGQKTIAKIVAANKGLDPNKLKAGQEIVLPK
jgi:nucleoid-associated protein YgaU